MVDAAKIMRDQLAALVEKPPALNRWHAEIKSIIADYDGFMEFLRHGEEDMMPKMAESAFTMSILPKTEEGKTDPKFCMELGAAIMLDKPIIALVSNPDMKVPDQLRRIAHDVVEIDLSDAASRETVAIKIRNLLEQLVEDGLDSPSTELKADDDEVPR